MNVLKGCNAEFIGVLLVHGTKLESDPFSELRANIPGSPGVDDALPTPTKEDESASESGTGYKFLVPEVQLELPNRPQRRLGRLYGVPL